jgi:hypothetical protein
MKKAKEPTEFTVDGLVAAIRSSAKDLAVMYLHPTSDHVEAHRLPCPGGGTGIRDGNAQSRQGGHASGVLREGRRTRCVPLSSKPEAPFHAVLF